MTEIEEVCEIETFTFLMAWTDINTIVLTPVWWVLVGVGVDFPPQLRFENITHYLL